MKPYRSQAFWTLTLLKDDFVWPGGYPLVAIMGDGEMICPGCARKNHEQILDAESRHDSWHLVGAEPYWEGPTRNCAHCNRPIESAYGDPDA